MYIYIERYRYSFCFSLIFMRKYTYRRYLKSKLLAFYTKFEAFLFKNGVLYQKLKTRFLAKAGPQKDKKMVLSHGIACF